MCGIAAIITRETSFQRKSIEKMIERLHHRGPDAQKVQCFEEIGVYLGHARLAVVDLTDAGAQPMTSPSGRYVITFNGELYNHRNIRSLIDLKEKSATWRGTSDTETLVRAIEIFGVHQAITLFEGMFAFVLLDKIERKLYCARDRFGEKPLYIHQNAKATLITSELKALRASGLHDDTYDNVSIAEFLQMGYITAPNTIWRDTKKVAPGSIIQIDLRNQELTSAARFWSFAEEWRNAREDPFIGSEDEAVLEIERLLLRATETQMIADVPVGTFLSGGIDSTLITALARHSTPHRLKTFSIGFNQKEYNEAQYASEIARHLGTDHTELYLDDQTAAKIALSLPEIYDEPFGDSSQVATVALCSLASRDLTVALTGDGGDELFAGYTRYQSTHRKIEQVLELPDEIKACAASLLKISEGIISSAIRLAGRSPEANVRKIKKAISILSGSGKKAYYKSIISQAEDVRYILASNVIQRQTREPQEFENAGYAHEGGLIDYLMALDTNFYLPDDILVKVDRAAMNSSLETRVPFLDINLARFAWRLPASFKLKGGINKYPLRQLANKHVPSSLMNRPKMGFGVPLRTWILGPFLNWAEDLLSPEVQEKLGVLNKEAVSRMWRSFKAGDENSYFVWNVLMLSAWLQNEKSKH